MTTDTAAHVIPKGQPVSAIVGGSVAWRVAKGARVGKYDLIAIVDDVEITAAYAGRVSALMIPEGGKVDQGAIIAYIDDGNAHARQKPLEAPTRLEGHNTPQTPVAPHSASQAPPDEPIADRSPVRRRGHVAPSEPVLTVLESGAGPVVKSKGRKRTKHAVYHVTEDQAGRVASLSFLFKSDPEAPNYSESEIMRAAVEHLLSQDRPTIEAILSHNRAREKSAGYGSGWKRPPRSKR